jgi:hypothetical protein
VRGFFHDFARAGRDQALARIEVARGWFSTCRPSCISSTNRNLPSRSITAATVTLGSLPGSKRLQTREDLFLVVAHHDAAADDGDRKADHGMFSRWKVAARSSSRRPARS